MRFHEMAMVVAAPASLIAIGAIWYDARVWWLSICALATGAVSVLLLQYWILPPLFMLGCFFGVAHLGSFFAVLLLVVETMLERRRPRKGKEEVANELQRHDP